MVCAWDWGICGWERDYKLIRIHTQGWPKMIVCIGPRHMCTRMRPLRLCDNLLAVKYHSCTKGNGCDKFKDPWMGWLELCNYSSQYNFAKLLHVHVHVKKVPFNLTSDHRFYTNRWVWWSIRDGLLKLMWDYQDKDNHGLSPQVQF